MDTTPIPPLCLEVILRDSSRYFVQSVIQKDKCNKSMVVRIWDMRAFDADDITDLQRKMNKAIKDGKDLSEVEHPRLDVGNLRIHLDDIWYCIEWHGRFWPETLKARIGF